MGDYEMTNHVVEFEQNRRIAWEPVLSAASLPEDQSSIGNRTEHRWIYKLTPVGRETTIVTETYDCTRAPEWVREWVENGNRWLTSMAETLEHLDKQCARGSRQAE
jgi:hypothetical protein